MVDTEAFIIKSIQQQIEIGARQDVAFSLGKGKNFKYFKNLNDKHSFFEKIIPLPHPRWGHAIQAKTER